VALIAATLERDGHEVQIFDMNVRLWRRYRHVGSDFWESHNFLNWEKEALFKQNILPHIEAPLQDMMAEVAAWGPDAAGFSIYDTSFLCTREAARALKKIRPQTKIIYGGPGSSLFNFEVHGEFSHGLVDAAVIGEGDVTVLEVVRRFGKGESLEGCLGVAHYESAKLTYAGPRPNIELTELPLPSFKGMDFTLYRDKQLPIMMSRGCVAKCTFCAETRFWKNYRYRDAKHIFSEFQNNVKRYGINSFYMADSLINGNFNVLNELVDLIIQSGEKYTWHGYARLDRRMTPELLDRLAQSGLTLVSYGLETGSQKVMDLMEKRTTVEKAREIIHHTHWAGVQVHLNMIVGFPGETESDFNETLTFLNDNISSITGVATGETLGIISGTPLFTHPQKYGVRTNDRGEPIFDQDGDWVSDDEDGPNTINIRRQRLTRLRDFLDRYPHIYWSPHDITRVVSTEPFLLNGKEIGGDLRLENLPWPKGEPFRCDPAYRPTFLHWSCNGVDYASPAEVGNGEFRAWLDPVVDHDTYHFRQEVRQACRLLDKKRGDKKVALCYSGGIDSELLAITLDELGIPYELFFLDLWGVNRKEFEANSADFLARTDKKVNLIQADKYDFYNRHVPQSMRDYAIEYPTYMALTYLFEKIPDSYYIVCGDGDLHREPGRFFNIKEKYPWTRRSQERAVAFPTSAILFYLWSSKNQRPGNYSFFSSTPELLAATIGHPLFENNFPESSTREMIYHEFPEIKPRQKTSNWEGPEGVGENKRIRKWASNLAKKISYLEIWKPHSYTAVAMTNLFRPPDRTQSMELNILAQKLGELELELSKVRRIVESQREEIQVLRSRS
jgi:radical SAM superfamily enzyme YgiQ (UPF0313 family)